MTFLLSGGALPVALVGLLMALLVCVGEARAGRRWAVLAWRVSAQALWLSAFLGIAYLTLWLANPNGGGVNLVPLEEIQRQLARQRTGLALFNLLGNAAMLVPFALLARPAWRWTWLQTTAAAMVVACAIETLQWLTGRSADVDDVLLNTAGAATAAMVAAWLERRGRRARPARTEPGTGLHEPSPNLHR